MPNDTRKKLEDRESANSLQLIRGRYRVTFLRDGLRERFTGAEMMDGAQGSSRDEHAAASIRADKVRVF
jgi:hypothetical protein